MTTDALGVLAAYRLVDRPFAADPWHELVGAAERHGLIGVLAAAVDDGVLTPSADQRTELDAQHEAYMVACIALERTLFDVDDVLGSIRVDLRILKGPALAHGLALDPSHRTFGDIDLLVRSNDVDATVAALVSAGAQRPSPELVPGYDRRFAKSVTLTWGTHEIDLHRTLAPGPFGLRVNEDDLWAGRASVTVAGRSFATLDTELHLLHGCYHAVLGDVEPRLASLRDIALLVAAPGLDLDRVLALGRAWQGESVLAAGLELTASRLPDRRGPLYDWAAGFEAPVDQQRLLASYRLEHRRFARQSRATLRALDSWSERAAFARAVVWPSRAHLDARGLSRWRHLIRR